MKNSTLLVILFFPIFIFSQNNPELIPFKKGDLWGFAAKDGTLKIKAQYDKVEFFRGDRAKVWKDKSQGFINAKGENLVELIYEKTESVYFDNQIFLARKGKKWGVVNAANKTLLKFNFDEIVASRNSSLMVKQNGLFGFYKLANGLFVTYLPLKYVDIQIDEYTGRYFFKGVLKNGDIEYLDKAGKLIQRVSQKNKNSQESHRMGEVGMEAAPPPPPPSDVNYPQFQALKSKGKSGIIIQRKSSDVRTYGQILTDTLLGDFQEIITKHSFSDAYVVKQNGKWGAINLAGQSLIPIEYDSIDIKSMKFQGRGGQAFIVQKNGKWGVIGNANKFQEVGSPNEVRIPFEYDAIRRNVNHTYYIVAKDKKFGIVNAENYELIVQPLYAHIKDTFTGVNKFAIFFITLENGDEVFVGENGVEFFSN